MTYTIKMLFKKTPFSYVQNLYQNTIKILTTETDEHIFSRIGLKRYLNNVNILPNAGCNCL